MKVVTSEQMRELERKAAEVGLPSHVLMENAGLAVAEGLLKLKKGVMGLPVVVLVGPGNNGDDGLVAARYLRQWGMEVCLYLCSPRSDDDRNLSAACECGIPITRAADDADCAFLRNTLDSTEVVVDSLLGTGRLRPIDGVYKEVLNAVRQAKDARPEMAILAVDLPSGMDADSGAADPSCLHADLTMTLGYPKSGLFSVSGKERVGQLIVADIGIPPSLAADLQTELLTPAWVLSCLPSRPLDANKGTFGRVMVAAGSVNYIGAAYLACAAAARVGAGLVTLATASGIQPVLASRLTETTYVPLPEAEYGVIGADAAKVASEHLKGYQALLMGPGLGGHQQTAEFVRALAASSRGRIAQVLDADALNILAGIAEWWHIPAPGAVITPHPGEMARLLGITVPEVQADRLGVAQRAAVLWGHVVVLKGAHTVIVAPDGRARLSTAANPGLASAGTGDVLAGAIAGLAAQGLPPFNAACCGVYLHAMAGELVAGEIGDTGMVAGDLLTALPVAIKRLKTGDD
ncbi:NAD(P)H-hydrate dehydratase [Chloroflexota bacterium]